MSKNYKSGDKQGNITFLYEFIKERSWGKEKLWMCRCSCGKEFYARKRALKHRWACWSCTVSKNLHERCTLKYNMLNPSLKRRVYKEYKRGAKDRGLLFELNFNDFLKIVEQDCVYCGEPPHIYQVDIPYTSKHDGPWLRNGIDRINTNKGYSLDNCVPCCSNCNYAKHTMSVDEYKKFIEKSYNHLFMKSSTTIPKGSTSQANGDGNNNYPILDNDIV